MTLQEFRHLVRREFGRDLRHMTPANAREFLDRVQNRLDGEEGSGRTIYLNEPEQTYEGIVRDFFRETLEMPSDQAVIRLWLYCLELASHGVAEIEADKFEKLFASIASGES